LFKQFDALFSPCLLSKPFLQLLDALFLLSLLNPVSEAFATAGGLRQPESGSG
jgi:hypothetical protein